MSHGGGSSNTTHTDGCHAIHGVQTDFWLLSCRVRSLSVLIICVGVVGMILGKGQHVLFHHIRHRRPELYEVVQHLVTGAGSGCSARHLGSVRIIFYFCRTEHARGPLLASCESCSLPIPRGNGIQYARACMLLLAQHTTHTRTHAHTLTHRRTHTCARATRYSTTHTQVATEEFKLPQAIAHGVGADEEAVHTYIRLFVYA